jgi:uncharacterized phage protein (TIGR01671 family)
VREIEFRAWLKSYKEIVKVDLLGKNKILSSRCWFDFKDIELMQYTGLKDKNGVKIFEGDIVKRITLFKAEILESINCVEFEKGCFILKTPSIKNYLFLCKEYELEVIGNIWENKELLEVKE